VQLGFGARKAKRTSKAQAGHEGKSIGTVKREQTLVAGGRGCHFTFMGSAFRPTNLKFRKLVPWSSVDPLGFIPPGNESYEIGERTKAG
jgi:hypothetical protein